MNYDYNEKKIVAVIDEGLPIGMALNALGHMSFSIGNFSDDSWMGKKEIVDLGSHIHKGISKYPFIVLKADKSEIKNLVDKAREKKMLFIDYPKEMFDTGHDDELVEAIGKSDDFTYHGIVIAGKTSELKEMTSHLRLYR
jgi:hypothetical protein